MSADNKKYRAYVFTLNNWLPEEEKAIDGLSYQYVIYGKEVGESGTPHLQGFIYWKNPISFKSMRKKIPRAHIEVCKCIPSAIEYCKKERDWIDHGLPPNQGERKDIDKVKDMLQQGSNLRGIILAAESYQSIRHAECHLKYFEKQRDHKPHVVWCYGSTGTGKSRYVYEECKDKDTYTAMSTGRWFEGYDAHTHVIIDDMRKDFMKFHELLRLLDRYAMRVECKGGSRQFVATHIYITSCHSPNDLFDTREDVGQLVRRIDEIKVF
jgi:hypothetical protein